MSQHSATDLTTPSKVESEFKIHFQLQWTYHTANSWGEDPDGRVCVGCGPQETFRACADIRIVQSDQQ